MKKVFVIAEAGVNHNGSVVLAKKLIDAAHDAGADAVKFQTFNSEKCLCKTAPKAEYQVRTMGKNISQLEMVKKLELNAAEHRELVAHCKKKRITFLSTAFDLDSVDLLCDLGVSTFKIPSGELTNLPLVRKIGGLKKKIILSTGMANIKEIKETVDVLIGQGTLKRNITILHCNTEYPTPFEDVNLLAMLNIRDVFKVEDRKSVV